MLEAAVPSFLRFPISAMLAAAMLLGGCVGIPADRGFSDVKTLVAERGGLVVVAPGRDAEAERQIADWLAAPLTVESAQRIALSRNPRLVEQYARLGIAQAAVYDAARISNPLFSLAVLDSNVAGHRVTLGLAQNFADLLNLSPRKRQARGQLERAQQQAAADLLDLAAEVEAAYFAHIGAVSVSELREAIALAGAASAELAQRFLDAGNINRLQLNREKAAATEARIAADRAEARMLAARTELNRLLGLTAEEDRWAVQVRLPLPVQEEDTLAELQRHANYGRLDLLAARKQVVLLEDALGAARSYRFIGDIVVGVERERDTDGSKLTGPTLELSLPIFNWGAGRVERARAELEQARATARALEIKVSNDVRLAQARVAGARGLAERYRGQLIPQREEVVQRSTELQNFMLIGQFELLAAKQQEFEAYQGYLEALAAYWTSRGELARAVGARLPSSTHFNASAVEPKDLIAPKSTDGAHGGKPDMDMKAMQGMKGMGHSGKDMQGMEGMKGMDHSGKDMKPPAGKPGMDMKGMQGKEGMKHDAPGAEGVAVQATCDGLKNADMKDPLMQALAQKCRSREKSTSAETIDSSRKPTVPGSQPAATSPSHDSKQGLTGGKHPH